ncbi:MAG: acylphosphatase [Nanoarchaeota archaeon]|nr:acylphosphatase [Nanoarchaeota archaeon]
MKRVHIFIRGRVQGVFFRANIQQRAVELDLKGYAQNCESDVVECVFEGDDEDIEEILEFCHEGPRKAKVRDVEVIEEKYEGEFDNFEVRV